MQSTASQNITRTRHGLEIKLYRLGDLTVVGLINATAVCHVEDGASGLVDIKDRVPGLGLRDRPTISSHQIPNLYFFQAVEAEYNCRLYLNPVLSTHICITP